MGLPSFLQRHDRIRIARQQRSIQREILDQIKNGNSMVRQPDTKAPDITVNITTPKGNFTVDDAIDRTITVNVPHTYETLTSEGEIVTVTKTITIELEITHG